MKSNRLPVGSAFCPARTVSTSDFPQILGRLICNYWLSPLFGCCHTLHPLSHFFATARPPYGWANPHPTTRDALVTFMDSSYVVSEPRSFQWVMSSGVRQCFLGHPDLQYLLICALMGSSTCFRWYISKGCCSIDGYACLIILAMNVSASSWSSNKSASVSVRGAWDSALAT